MATYYWVGGTGSWDATSTTNWASSSGGAGGAGVPTSADDVIFDANSNVGTGAFTVTVTGTSAAPAVCNDFTASGLDGAMTLTQGATSVLDIYGSLTLPVTNLTWTGVSGNLVRFRATTTGKTVTTNGVSIGGGTNSNVDFNGVAGGWTLGSALTTSGNVVVSAGTFNTGNFNVTAIQFNSQFSNLVKASNFGSSTITLSSSNAFFLGGTNLSFNAGTSSIVCTAGNASFDGFSRTFHNVSFTSTAGGTQRILGANTFNDLTFTSLAATGVRNISIEANQTVTGTLTLGTANTAIRRMFVRSDVVGTPRTITANTVATLADVDFRDIVGAGTGTWSGTRLGNCGGNTGITFDAGKTVYCVASTNQNYINNIWALSSGGAVDVNNFPLAQDTAIFDTNSTLATLTFNSSGGFNTGAINFSALTTGLTVNINNSINLYGDLTLDENVTMTGTQPIIFLKRDGIQKVTTAGRTITNLVGIDATTLQLQDAITISNTEFYHNYGTLDLNGFDCICVRYAQLTTLPRSINFGTNKIVVTGNATSVIGMAVLTNFTYTGTPRFEANYSGSVGTRTFDIGRAGGATESNVPDVYITAGSDIIDMRNNGQSHFRTLDFTGFTGSTSANQQLFAYGNLTYSAGMTVTAGTSLTFLKSSGTQTLTTNGKTIDFPVTKNGAGTLQLADNLTLGSTRTLTHTAGTIDVNDFTLTTGVYSSTGSTARQLDVGSGTLSVGGNFTASGSNYTTAGTGTISMTSATTKTFAGGGFTYPTLNQGGAGELVITGANTFANITNTNATASTITFPNVTTTVTKFNLSGTAGNIITLRRTGASGTWTLAKTSGKAYVDYVSISNSSTTANTFYAGINSTDGGNNTNWVFNHLPQLTWVGGSGTWNQSDATNWSFVSGGDGDFAVPTSADDVYFDVNSDNDTGFTVLIDNAECKDLNIAGLQYTMTIDYNSSVISVNGDVDATSATLLAKTGDGNIDMLSANTKTFAGGGFAYPTLTQAGAGDLIITGNNTFGNLTNSVNGCTVKFAAGSTNLFNDFSLNGVNGDLVKIQSTITGSPFYVGLA